MHGDGRRIRQENGLSKTERQQQQQQQQQHSQQQQRINSRQAQLLLSAVGQRTTTLTSHDINAGTPRDWPDSRDVWTSPKDDGVFIAVNDDAHLTLVVGDVSLRRCILKAASFYEDVERALRSRGMEFCWDETFGFLQASPAHLGSEPFRFFSKAFLLLRSLVLQMFVDGNMQMRFSRHA